MWSENICEINAKTKQKIKNKKSRSLLTIKINKHLQKQFTKKFTTKTLIVNNNLHMEVEGVIFRGYMSCLSCTNDNESVGFPKECFHV